MAASPRRTKDGQVALQIPNSQAALQAQATDVVSRGDKVDYGKDFHVHDNRLLQESDITG